MLPSPVWYVCGLWAAPGWSIPWVWLSAGVVTADGCRNAFSCHDKVAVATLYPVVTGLLSQCRSPSRWYRDGLGGRNNTCVA
ncbi:hypothetical protein Taro_036947 [Colocasia esculenta]|uniref:Uncharacterized protein n=1 Tax=Colocasia esculenta TaxID=4460 RepID=A0A843WJB0_COLES|nr:hypothetical protein [Colocasia esculenta]